MKFLRKWLLAMIGPCLVSAHCAVAQNTEDRKPVLVQTAVPTGPYAAWPDDVKVKAVDALMFRCSMVGVMQLGTYSGPKEAGKEYLQVLAAACVDGQMPDDWPGRPQLIDSQKHHFELARQLDTSLEMPPPLRPR